MENNNKAPNEIELINIMNEIFLILSSIQNKEIKNIIEDIFSSKEFQDNFLVAPAAIKYHHNYQGGLAEHTLQVMRGVQAILFNIDIEIRNFISQDEKDLLILSAFCHDLGKMRNYIKVNGKWENNPNVKQQYHNDKYVAKCMTSTEDVLKDTLDEFNTPTVSSLMDLIYRHHGITSWGSKNVSKGTFGNYLFLSDYFSSNEERLEKDNNGYYLPLKRVDENDKDKNIDPKNYSFAEDAKETWEILANNINNIMEV